MSNQKNTIFISTRSGFWKRSDDDNWTLVSKENVWSMTECGGNLYAGSYANGILASTDDGSSWQNISEDLKNTARQRGYITISTLGCFNNNIIMAGSLGDGFFYKGIEGVNWIKLNSGIKAPVITGISIYDNTVYISTPSGVYKNNFSTIK
ncbi:hypothetical protein OO013_16645 [Mangrovivirga sp. M17]|uniref:Photosynthesis system II assembly factor Ycf48/Hcf136-like domain-containing protein n=1 Tax=Mangrovivirga halotolerans TaxID=2993936 RepID=A0ABT3RUQ1_9BACT|nr:hypothetical protein [Mangrovivirga halotolerans]MCX2745511.1 hypothetical protein [Mangrovivirga halotolerans]